MSKKLLDDMGDLQRSVMEQIWELGEATVHQVRERLIANKHLAYTTVLTAMQKLEMAGWLRHRSDGKTYIYIPMRTREQASGKSLTHYIERMFGGNTLLLFQHLMRESQLSENELKELRKMINDKRKEQKK